MTQPINQAAPSRAERPFDLPAMPTIDGRELDLRPTLRAVHDRVAQQVDERFPQESEEQRAERLRTIMQRIWSMIRNLLQRFSRQMGVNLQFARPSGQGTEAPVALGETEKIAPTQSPLPAAGAIVPPAVQDAALQQEVHAFARHLLDAGPRVELLSDPASAEAYLLATLQQLRSIGEGQEAMVHRFREQQHELVTRIAIAEGASPALVERELQSGAFTMLDREGRYKGLTDDIARARAQQQRVRNAMASLISATYEHAETSGLPKERIDAVAGQFEPFWEEILAEWKAPNQKPASAAPSAPNDDGMAGVLEEIGAQPPGSAHDPAGALTEVASAHAPSAHAIQLAANASPYAKSRLGSPFAAFVAQPDAEEEAARRERYAEEGA